MDQQVDAALVHAIAAELGSSWRANIDPQHRWGASIERPADRARLWVVFRDGKIEVSGSFPQGRDGYTYGPRDPRRIGCSPSRGARAIARDIQRRFLSWYEEEYANAVQRRDESERQLAWRDATIQELAETLETEVYHPHGRSSEPRVHVNYRGLYGNVEVSPYNQTVKIELSGIPVDLAHQILTIIREGA
ncbi:MAG: hypothetical protein GX601_05615 [Anaerolineales bacterium]|nr:hypothetical protein [Anaerolineales bacterium]